jgi:uncharacterized membrane protein YkgB
MNRLLTLLAKIGVLKDDIDYHLIRASMVIIFAFFGYQKWFDYEAQALIPYISHGPLIFWMYPVFGVRGATYFLGVAEWLFGGLLFLGFWNKKLEFSERLVRAFLLSPPSQLSRLCQVDGLRCRRVPRHDRERRVPDEGSRSLCGVLLSA